MTTSGRASLAIAIVLSLEWPSTMIVSSTQRGMRCSTYAMFSASLSVGITTLADGVAESCERKRADWPGPSRWGRRRRRENPGITLRAWLPALVGEPGISPGGPGPAQTD